MEMVSRGTDHSDAFRATLLGLGYLRRPFDHEDNPDRAVEQFRMAIDFDLTSTECLYGGAGGALLAATFMIACAKEVRRPPCPTCPPFCLCFRWLALGFYIIAVIVAWFLGGWFIGIHASGWYIIFVAFFVLTIAGYLRCFLMNDTSS